MAWEIGPSPSSLSDSPPHALSSFAGNTPMNNLSPLCQNCGAELQTAPSGRPKRFCDDLCRQASRKAISAHNGLRYRGGPETPKPGLQDAVLLEEFKPETPARKTKPLKFEKI